MGWGSGEREEQGRRRILQLAQQNGVQIYAPCSTAWARVRRERPDLALQAENDKSHPGDLGHFLNLACFYAAFTEGSPEGRLPREFSVWPHFSKEQKDAMEAEIETAFRAFKPNDYQARLPEWMQKNAAVGLRASLSNADARYLERVASEEWQKIQKQLARPN